MISQMIEIEKKWKNVPVSYIPKTSLNVSSEELDIKNGDIIAITTNIKRAGCGTYRICLLGGW